GRLASGATRRTPARPKALACQVRMSSVPSAEHPVRSHDGRAHGDGLLLTAVRNVGRELAEGGDVAQGYRASAGLFRHDVDEGDTVLQPEAGISEAGGLHLVELGEHLLDKLLVLLGAIWLGPVADDDGRHGGSLVCY